MVLGSAVELAVSSPLTLAITVAAGVVLLAVLRVLANTFHGSRPPIFEGMPFVGGLMKFAGVRVLFSPCCCPLTRGRHPGLSDSMTPHGCPTQGPWKLMHTGYAQLGEVFTVPVAHKRVTFLIGPDVAPHFFKGTDDEMSQTEVRQIVALSTQQATPQVRSWCGV
jgi:sterol 14-demethylase